jgi:hypothetical protein
VHWQMRLVRGTNQETIKCIQKTWRVINNPYRQCKYRTKYTSTKKLSTNWHNQ